MSGSKQDYGDLLNQMSIVERDYSERYISGGELIFVLPGDRVSGIPNDQKEKAVGRVISLDRRMNYLVKTSKGTVCTIPLSKLELVGQTSKNKRREENLKQRIMDYIWASILDSNSMVCEAERGRRLGRLPKSDAFV